MMRCRLTKGFSARLSMTNIDIRCAGCDLHTEEFVVADRFGIGTRLCPTCDQAARENPALTLDDLCDLAWSADCVEIDGVRSDLELDDSEQRDIAAFFKAVGRCREAPASDDAQDELSDARGRVCEQALRCLRVSRDLPPHYRHLLDVDQTFFVDVAVAADEEHLALPDDLTARFQKHLARIDRQMKHLLADGFCEDDAAALVCALEEVRAGRAVCESEVPLSTELKVRLLQYATIEKLIVRFRE